MRRSIKMKRIFALIISFVIVYGVIGQEKEADAVMISYTDETAFIAAIGSGLTTVNFDTDPNGNTISAGTLIDQQYLSVGADFNPFASGTPKTGNFTNISSPNVLWDAVGEEGGANADFEVVFTTPVNGTGIFFGGLQDIGTTTFEVFDVSSSSLGSFDVYSEAGGNPLGFVFFGVTSDDPIAKLQVNVDAADFVWFDDLEFGASTTVPEPTTIVLLSIGLAGLAGGAIKRRLKKTKR